MNSQPFSLLVSQHTSSSFCFMISLLGTSGKVLSCKSAPLVNVNAKQRLRHQTHGAIRRVTIHDVIAHYARLIITLSS